MTNYTAETYQTKRDILTFAEKITKDTFKPTQKFSQDMVYGILCGGNCLLSEVARKLKEPIKLQNTVERLSDNLNKLEDSEIENIKKNYYEEVMKYLPQEYVIVLNDNTDLNKEYSSKLEDLCIVKDASSQVERYVNGYHVCEYCALSEKEKSPISLYSKVYSTTSKDFKSENDETIKGEDKVIEILKEGNRRAIFVRDRGYDANEFLIKDIKEDNKFVTRLVGTRSLIFKDKKRLVKDVASERKGKIVTNLMYHGENTECHISYTRVKLPACDSKDVTLVTIHNLSEDGVPMMLLTNLPVKGKDDAEYIVRLYFLRWRIEEYFKAKKATNWENSLVRTLKSIDNLNLFLTICMTYLSILTEKLSTNFNSNIILERAQSLKKRFLVYLSVMATGIFEILKYAHTGIKDWRKKERRKKKIQLQLTV